MSKGSKKKTTPRKPQQQQQQLQQQQGFPPPIPPDIAAHYFSQLAQKAKHNKRNNSASLSFGSLDLAALAQSGDLSAATAAASAQKPCSEQEVKALMSMFAEIMGMEEPPSSSNSKMPVFMFGNKGSRNSISASMTSHFEAAMNSTMMADLDDEEEDDDDADDDDDDSDDDLSQKQPPVPTKISPEDWNELEQVVTEEQLAEEDRHKKAMKRREKKHRKKDRVRQEREDKAVAAAEKKHSAKIQSWKSRLVSAAQSNDVSKLDALLGESPLGEKSEIQVCMEFLWPTCIAKSRDLVGENTEARLALASYVLLHQPDVVASTARVGRNSLHLSSLIGDYPFLRFVIQKLRKNTATEELTALLDITCEDSGWTALHYAVVSTSIECTEALLAAGVNVQIRTDSSKTKFQDNGLTPRELAQAIVSGKVSDIECLGLAIEDLEVESLSSGRSRRQYHDLLKELIDRLTGVEVSGYTPPLSGPFAQEDQEEEKDEISPSRDDALKKKRKKKKKQLLEEPTTVSVKPSQPLVDQEDPMITALLGMGFTRDQITQAVNALGGTNNATADDVVVWIFGQNEGETQSPPIPSISNHKAVAQPSKEIASDEHERRAATQAKTNKLEAAKKVEEERVAAQRLAAKREEQRRRNRDWNNREQTRQREEAQAKLALALELKAKADAQQMYPQQEQLGYMPSTFAPSTPNIPNQYAGVPRGLHQNVMDGGAYNALVGGVPGLSPGVMYGMHAAIPRAPGVHHSRTHEYMHAPGHVAEMPSSDFSGLARDGFYEEDVATVSSFEIRSGSIQGDSYSIQPSPDAYQDRLPFAPMPPGFDTPAPGFQEIGTHDVYDSNHTGEIRATARAFVPTVTFTRSPATSSGRGSTPVLLAGNSLAGLSTPSNNSIIPSQSIAGSVDTSSMDCCPSLLPSAPRHISPHPGLFDHPSIPTPPMTYPPIIGAASSITGLPSNADITLPPPGGFARDLDKSISGSSSLYVMPPTSSQGSIGGGFDNAVAATSGLALWGSGMPTAPAPSDPILLGGLLNLGDDNSVSNDRNGAASLPLNPGWNAVGPQYNNGGAHSNGLGSIW